MFEEERKSIFVKSRNVKYLLLIFFCVTSLSCQNLGRLSFVGDLSKKLNEVSGLEYASGSDFLWAINDSGNAPKIFLIDTANGGIMLSYKLKKAKNRDWEDLTYAEDGRLFVGDFGNNANNRKDQKIYFFDPADITEAEEIKLKKISFSFEDQEDFPPMRKDRNFDVESFFYMKENLYLVTRNRSSNFDGTTNVYKIPAENGEHVAKLVASFKSCSDPVSCQITAADYHPESNTIALLSYDKVWLLSEFTDDAIFDGKIELVELGHQTQKESLCFIDEKTLMIADEKSGFSGGNLYQLKL